MTNQDEKLNYEAENLFANVPLDKPEDHDHHWKDFIILTEES